MKDGGPVHVCANGEPMTGPHPLCEAEVDRGCAEFDRLVAAVVYDSEGYTPAERAAKDRRAVESSTQRLW